jgi:hypothetical protein
MYNPAQLIHSNVSFQQLLSSTETNDFSCASYQSASADPIGIVTTSVKALPTNDYFTRGVRKF